MNKKDLVEYSAMKADISLQKAETVINSVLEAIERTLAQGETVNLHGFGQFKVTNRSARRVRHVGTGEMVTIPAHKHPQFVVGKKLKDAIK